jgi:putative FmdB family regulatory protein
MPIYEYRCNHCHCKFSQLLLKPAQAATMTCIYCEASQVTRLMSSFAIHRSTASRLADVDLRRSASDDFYADSRNIGLRARQQFQQRGLQPPAQFEEVVEKARSGKFLQETQDT